MAILRPDKDKDKEKLPRILLVPPPDLPVPAVQGGAVETLLTHLIRENERQGKLDLLCASVPDEAARRASEGLQHTKMLYIPRPHGHRRYWPMVFVERCLGIAAPYDPWYQKVQLALALELPGPDLIVAEGGNLTQCSAISRMFGRRRCLAHLHGQTACNPVMDTIYGGILALSEFIRDDYLKTSTLDPKHAYIWYNCVDTRRFCPGPPPLALRTRLGFGARDFVVLFCGRLDPDKGIHKLMEALALLPVPQIKLLIVGSPFFGRTQQSSFLRKLEQQARALGNRVQFTGYIPNEDLPDYYRLADLVCGPTLVEEAAGLGAVKAARRCWWNGATTSPTSWPGASGCCMSTRLSAPRWGPPVPSGPKISRWSVTIMNLSASFGICSGTEVLYEPSCHLCGGSGLSRRNHPGSLCGKYSLPAGGRRRPLCPGGRRQPRHQRCYLR